jgi:hypothetical protein
MLMSQRGNPARLHYMANGFRILSAGDHVLCGLSGAAITLDSLRYWSVARQQAYATPELATKAMLGA